jgi:hypothetical protein
MEGRGPGEQPHSKKHTDEFSYSVKEYRIIAANKFKQAERDKFREVAKEVKEVVDCFICLTNNTEFEQNSEEMGEVAKTIRESVPRLINNLYELTKTKNENKFQHIYTLCLLLKLLVENNDRFLMQVDQSVTTMRSQYVELSRTINSVKIYVNKLLSFHAYDHTEELSNIDGLIDLSEQLTKNLMQLEKDINDEKRHLQNLEEQIKYYKDKKEHEQNNPKGKRDHTTYDYKQEYFSHPTCEDFGYKCKSSCKHSGYRTIKFAKVSTLPELTFEQKEDIKKWNYHLENLNISRSKSVDEFKALKSSYSSCAEAKSLTHNFIINLLNNIREENGKITCELEQMQLGKLIELIAIIPSKETITFVISLVPSQNLLNFSLSFFTNVQDLEIHRTFIYHLISLNTNSNKNLVITSLNIILHSNLKTEELNSIFCKQLILSLGGKLDDMLNDLAPERLEAIKKLFLDSESNAIIKDFIILTMNDKSLSLENKLQNIEKCRENKSHLKWQNISQALTNDSSMKRIAIQSKTSLLDATIENKKFKILKEWAAQKTALNTKISAFNDKMNNAYKQLELLTEAIRDYLKSNNDKEVNEVKDKLKLYLNNARCSNLKKMKVLEAIFENVIKRETSVTADNDKFVKGQSLWRAVYQDNISPRDQRHASAIRKCYKDLLKNILDDKSIDNATKESLMNSIKQANIINYPLAFTLVIQTSTRKDMDKTVKKIAKKQ